MTESRQELTRDPGGRKEGLQRGRRELLGVTDISIILIMVMVLQVYKYVKNIKSYTLIMCNFAYIKLKKEQNNQQDIKYMISSFFEKVHTGV